MLVVWAIETDLVTTNQADCWPPAAIAGEKQMINHPPSITMPFWAYRKLLRPFFLVFSFVVFVALSTCLFFYQQISSKTESKMGCMWKLHQLLPTNDWEGFSMIEGCFLRSEICSSFHTWWRNGISPISRSLEVWYRVFSPLERLDFVHWIWGTQFLLRFWTQDFEVWFRWFSNGWKNAGSRSLGFFGWIYDWHTQK